MLIFWCLYNFEDDTIEVDANGRSVRKRGKVKTGSNRWIRSKHYLFLQSQLLERQRKMAETRKRSHGELVNEILAVGKTINTEKLSYQGFQKMFGKSVGKRAPGLFLKKTSL